MGLLGTVAGGGDSAAPRPSLLPRSNSSGCEMQSVLRDDHAVENRCCVHINGHGRLETGQQEWGIDGWGDTDKWDPAKRDGVGGYRSAIFRQLHAS